MRKQAAFGAVAIEGHLRDRQAFVANAAERVASGGQPNGARVASNGQRFHGHVVRPVPSNIELKQRSGVGIWFEGHDSAARADEARPEQNVGSYVAPMSKNVSPSRTTRSSQSMTARSILVVALRTPSKSVSYRLPDRS